MFVCLSVRMWTRAVLYLSLLFPCINKSEKLCSSCMNRVSTTFINLTSELTFQNCRWLCQLFTLLAEERFSFEVKRGF